MEKHIKFTVNTCEGCGKEYNLGNPYYCSSCITEEYYSDDEDYDEDSLVSIDEFLNNI